MVNATSCSDVDLAAITSRLRAIFPTAIGATAECAEQPSARRHLLSAPVAPSTAVIVTSEIFFASMTGAANHAPIAAAWSSPSGLVSMSNLLDLDLVSMQTSQPMLILLAPPPPPLRQSESQPLSAGGIVGIVFGSITLLICAAAAVAYGLSLRKQRLKATALPVVPPTKAMEEEGV